ncbi:MAG: hypothetical protein ACRDQU_03000 [Pseudonocardiaceae bacterium]
MVAVTVTCPDCNTRTTGQHLTHQKTCPLGIAIDERTAADREWFQAHRWASEYRRPLHWSERAELVMWGIWPDVDGDAVGRVLVCRLGPGLRVRSFDEVAVILDSPRVLR